MRYNTVPETRIRLECLPTPQGCWDNVEAYDFDENGGRITRQPQPFVEVYVCYHDASGDARIKISRIVRISIYHDGDWVEGESRDRIWSGTLSRVEETQARQLLHRMCVYLAKGQLGGEAAQEATADILWHLYRCDRNAHEALKKNIPEWAGQVESWANRPARLGTIELDWPTGDYVVIYDVEEDERFFQRFSFGNRYFDDENVDVLYAIEEKLIKLATATRELIERAKKARDEREQGELEDEEEAEAL